MMFTNPSGMISWQFPLIIILVSIIFSTVLFRYGRIPFSLIVFPLVMVVGYVLEPLAAEMLQVRIDFWAKYQNVCLIAYWSLVCSSAYILGYLVMEGVRFTLNPKIGTAKINLSMIKAVKCVNPLLFFLIVAILVLAMLYIEGGISKLWYSPLEKGFGQFQMGAFERVVNSLGRLLIAAIPFITAIHWIRYRGGWDRIILVCALSIVVLYYLHQFSRWAFLPLFFFVLMLSILEPDYKKLVLLLLSLCLSLFGFWLGVKMRVHVSGIGLVHYLDLGFIFNKSNTSIGKELVGFLGTLSGTNVGAMIIQHNGIGGRSHQLIEYLILLLPLPSSIALPLSGIETSLSHDLRRFDTGLPYDALSETLIFIGEKTIFFTFILGSVTSFIDNYFFSERQHYVKGAGVLFAMLLGYIVSIHSGVRASTRMTLYVFAMLLIVKLVKHYNKRVFYK